MECRTRFRVTVVSFSFRWLCGWNFRKAFIAASMFMNFIGNIRSVICPTCQIIIKSNSDEKMISTFFFIYIHPENTTKITCNTLCVNFWTIIFLDQTNSALWQCYYSEQHFYSIIIIISYKISTILPFLTQSSQKLATILKKRKKRIKFTNFLQIRN